MLRLALAGAVLSCALAATGASAAGLPAGGVRAAAGDASILQEAAVVVRRGPVRAAPVRVAPRVRAAPLRARPPVARALHGRPVVAVRRWRHRPHYGLIIGGVTLGTILAASAYALTPPAPGLCWYWVDPTRTRGYWDYCY